MGEAHEGIYAGQISELIKCDDIKKSIRRLC
jgi:hypothetical protein